jgi:quercetin 2,3-dioxygenase
MTPTVQVIRSGERFHTGLPWLDSNHSFSFGHHYDSQNTHHGLLLVSNDDIVKAGTGFQTHPHRDMEIVTWVLDGELEHKDSEGHHGILYPGLAQRMSAGTGIWHSEMNPRGDRDVHFVQMWVPPDTMRITPAYQQLDITASLEKGGLVPVASGKGHDSAIAIRQKGATLWAGRLHPDEAVQVPDARYAHLYVAKGSMRLEGQGDLNRGDAVRLIAAGARQVTAGSDGAEVLVWTFDDRLEE